MFITNKHQGCKLPFDSVAVVLGALVVVVVVSFSVCDQCEEERVGGGAFFVIWVIPKGVGQTVDREDPVPGNEAREYSKEERSHDPISVDKVADNRWNDQPSNNHDPRVILRVPYYYRL